MALLKRIGFALLPILLAFAVATILLLLVGASPLEAYRQLIEGSLGSPDKISDTLMVWVPMVLAAAGLLMTFAAGLWNIGVEGQIVMGAIAASFVARNVTAPTEILVPLTMIGGILGGAVWALLAGVLRTYGKVNEIFGGLGLNFVALGFTIYLIIGPWARVGIASTSGTDTFPRPAWMPTLEGLRVAPFAIVLAAIAVIIVYVLLRGTFFGLRLKAVGKNMRSAHLLGVPMNRYMLSAFTLCGVFAGLAGAIQATGFQHKLVPAISGGYGYLGILVAMLAGYRASWIAPIALFFAAISVGSTQLQLRLNLDSSLGGIIQGMLVLFVLLIGAWQEKRRRQNLKAEG
ncbi:MAG TPA: ABC transporter permease [Anaerolineae bacterium]|nr:ABC transporter permease [Anaerolineae bacterium]